MDFRGMRQRGSHVVMRRDFRAASCLCTVKSNVERSEEVFAMQEWMLRPSLRLCPEIWTIRVVDERLTNPSLVPALFEGAYRREPVVELVSLLKTKNVQDARHALA